MFYVEHRKTRLFLPISLLFMLLILVGCKKPLENPELVDPIYIELKDAAEKIRDNLKEEQKALNEAKKELKETDLTVGEKRQVLKQISAGERKMVLMKQDRKFFELRSKSRIKHVQEVYPGRFEKDLPWPDLEEIAVFEANKRLRGASRNWADNIPKLKYSPEKPAAKVEEAAE